MEEDKEKDEPKFLLIFSKNYLHLFLQYLHLIFFCFLGVSLRFFLFSNFGDSSGILDKDIIPNALGCFFISFISEFKKPISKLSESQIYKKSITRILTGFTTGFCGCLTTFSSWQYEVVSDFYQKNYSFYFYKQISGIAYCILFYNIGRDISPYFYSLINTKENESDEGRNENIEETQNPIEKDNIIAPILSLSLEFFIFIFLFASIGVIIWLTTVRNIYGYILLSAPFGCILRYQICLYNTKLKEKTTLVPFYTMYANVFGLFVLTLCHAFQHRTTHNYALDFIKSVEIGFCGSLTTVSTFIQELDSLNEFIIQKYIYYILTILISNPISFFVTFLFDLKIQ
eukprot:gene10753-3372_t